MKNLSCFFLTSNSKRNGGMVFNSSSKNPSSNKTSCNQSISILKLIFCRKGTSNAFAHEIFARADRNGTKLLDRGEIKQIFKDLQIYAKKKKINEIIDRYDYNKDGNIDFDEFKILVKELLRKEELVPIFKKYSPGWLSNNYSEPSMTLLQLHQFFQTEQKQELTLDELRSMNEKFKDVHSAQPCVSFDLFNDLIFSMLNTIFNAELSTQYQVIL